MEIDSSDAPPGTYTVELESYNRNSPLATPAALRTDQVQVTVTCSNEYASSNGLISAVNEAINWLEQVNYEVHSPEVTIPLPPLVK